MRILNKLKKDGGATLSDVVIAIMIFIILASTVMGMFFKLYFNISMIRMNAIAVNYAINILERIDELSYEEVLDNYNFRDEFDIPEEFGVNVSVENYKKTNNPNDKTKDIIKKVTVSISYGLQNTVEDITINKLKIKEM